MPVGISRRNINPILSMPEDKKKTPLGCWAIALLPYAILIIGLLQGEHPVMALIFVIGGLPVFLILPALLSEAKDTNKKDK